MQALKGRKILPIHLLPITFFTIHHPRIFSRINRKHLLLTLVTRSQMQRSSRSLFHPRLMPHIRMLLRKLKSKFTIKSKFQFLNGKRSSTLLTNNHLIHNTIISNQDFPFLICHFLRIEKFRSLRDFRVGGIVASFVAIRNRKIRFF